MPADQLHPWPGQNTQAERTKFHKTDCDSLRIPCRLFKSRIPIDFNFYKNAGELIIFGEVWCCEELLCTVIDRELCFTSELDS